MARASKHRGLLTEAVRLVEESLSDYQLSKETKELDERLERLQRQQTSVETNPEATPENTAAAFRKTWKTAVLLAEVGQTQTAKVRAMKGVHEMCPEIHSALHDDACSRPNSIL